MRGDFHPRCDLLPRLLCFDRNVLHLSLLQSPRRQTTWFLWMCLQFLVIPLVFYMLPTSFFYRLHVVSIIVHWASIRIFFTCHFCVVHYVLDMIVVERDVIFVFARFEEYKTSTMPSTSFISRHHAFTHHVSFAHSFDFFCFRFSIFTICSCCCCVLVCRLCFHFFTFCLRCGFFVAAVFIFFIYFQ